MTSDFWTTNLKIPMLPMSDRARNLSVKFCPMFRFNDAVVVYFRIFSIDPMPRNSYWLFQVQTIVECRRYIDWFRELRDLFSRGLLSVFLSLSLFLSLDLSEVLKVKFGIGRTINRSGLEYNGNSNCDTKVADWRAVQEERGRGMKEPGVVIESRRWIVARKARLNFRN